MKDEWSVEYTDEFYEWWETLDEGEQDAIDRCVELLIRRGPNLPRPYADTVQGSKHKNMKELRTQHEGRPYRTFFAGREDPAQFTPQRSERKTSGRNAENGPQAMREDRLVGA